MLQNDLDNEKIKYDLKYTIVYFEQSAEEKIGIQMLKGTSNYYSIFNVLFTSNKHLKQVRWLKLLCYA